jgi:septum formation protein
MKENSVKRKILLGSASKPRSWVFDQIGLQYDTQVSNSFEKNPLLQDSITEESAKTIVLENSLHKLNNILSNLDAIEKQQYFGIICFDTIIWFPPDNYISKPTSKKNLTEILELLSGKTHKVLTAFAYVPISREGEILKSIRGVDTCLVTFIEINKFLLDKYTSNLFLLKFAGGYNIQGSSALFIEKIDGDYYTVVGVPLNLWIKKLEQYNFDNYKELVNSLNFR